MINYSLSRCVKTSDYEEWNYYISQNGRLSHINKAIIFFKSQENIIYLLSPSKSDLEDTEFLGDVIQLIHDLPTDFRLITELLEEDDDELVAKRIEELIKENQ